MAHTDEERYIESKKITWYSIWRNLFLSLIKIIGGYYGNSQALLADGIHSFSDLLSDFLVIFAAKMGAQEADYNHPYGHGRFETLGALAIAMIVFIAAAGILWDAGYELWTGSVASDLHPYVLGIALLSIIMNEMIYRVTIKVANKINSALLRANAWHSRLDGFSSVVVLIGAAGTLMGYHYCDAIAAIVVGLMVMKMSYHLAKPSLFELVDTALPDADVQQIRDIINDIPGVRSLHQLRTRSIRDQGFIDVHVLVDPRISVSEGHYIGENVEYSLKKKCKDVADVTVHIDPEDDEFEPVSAALPPRHTLLEKCRVKWANCPHYDQIARIDLHYLAGKIHIDLLFYPIHSIEVSMDKTYREAVDDISDIANVNIFISL